MDESKPYGASAPARLPFWVWLLAITGVIFGGIGAISGFSSLYTVSQSINNGACAFLSKPFSIKELMQTVVNAISA